MEQKNSRTYKYTLQLLQKLNDKTTQDILELSPNQKEKVKLGDFSYDVTLTTLQFHRKVYQPSTLEVELQFDGSGVDVATTPEKIIGALMYRLASLSIAEVISQNGKVNVGEDNTIAQNYFVYKVNPQLVMQANGTPNLLVKLGICSIDKLMTINKYSKAYVAQKLGTLLASNATLFKINDASPVKVNIGSLQKLVYMNNDKETEFIQPYLVQYNESFYDFMARTANRCGEFFFFEDGQVTLGLPYKKVKTITNYQNITFQQASDAPFAVSDFGWDSVKSGEGKVEGTLALNSDPVERTGVPGKSDSFPKDIFPTELSYNSEINPDEFFMPLYKGCSTNLVHETFEDFGMHLGMAASSLVRFNQTADAIIKGLVVYELATNILGGLAVVGRKDFDKEFVSDVKDTLYGSEKSDDEKALQFGPLNPKAWATMEYHSQVKKHEQAQQKKMVCVDMGTSYADIHLGDRICFSEGGQVYVVVEVKLDSRTQQSQVFYAIPTVDKEGRNVFPPVYGGDAIRKSGAQNAFVVAANDPKVQGRVRVIFPWQVGDPKICKLCEEAKENLKAETKALKKLEQQLETEQENLRVNGLIGSSKLDTLSVIQNEINGITEKLKQPQKELKATIASLEKQKTALSIVEKNPNTPPVSIVEKQTEIQMLEAKKASLSADIKKLEAEKAKFQALKKEVDGVSDWKAYTKKKKEEKETIESKIKDLKSSISDQKKKGKDAEKKEEEAQKLLIEDRKTMATPWIRVTTPFAGDGGGMQCRMNPGDEVMVDFEQGNVERPFIIGMLYSKDKPAPGYYNNRSSQPALVRDAAFVMQTRNGHNITIKDGTSMFDFLAGTTPGTSIYGASIAPMIAPGFTFGKEMAGSFHIGDRYGFYSLDMSSSLRNITLKSALGNVTIDAFTGITITAPNGNVRIEGKNIDIVAGNKVNIVSGQNIKTPEKKLPTLDDDRSGFERTLSYGGTVMKHVVPGGVKHLASQIIANVVYPSLNLDFLRTVLEVFLRPVDGTMTIKSKRYMLLEAGSGDAQIDPGRFGDKQKALVKQTKVEPGDEIHNKYDEVMKVIGCVSPIVDSFCDTYLERWNNLVSDVKAFNLCTDFKDNQKPDFVNDVLNSNDKKQYAEGDLASAFKDDTSQQDRTLVLNILNHYCDRFYPFKTMMADPVAEIAEPIIQTINVPDRLHSKIRSAFKATIDEYFDYNKWKDTVTDPAKLVLKRQFEEKIKVRMKRRFAMGYLMDNKDDISTVFKINISTNYKTALRKNYDWIDMVKQLDTSWHAPVRGLGSIAQWLADAVALDKLKDVIGVKDWQRILYYRKEEDMWNQNAGGQILMSDNSQYTYHMMEGNQVNHAPSIQSRTAPMYRKDMWFELKKALINLK